MKTKTERHFFKAIFSNGNAVRVYAISKESAEKSLLKCGCEQPESIELGSFVKPQLPTTGKMAKITNKGNRIQGIPVVSLPFKMN